MPAAAAEPAWIDGLLAHFNYLTKTPPSYFTGPYQSAHTENPASPYYTSAGDVAGRSSDLAWGYWGSPVDQIDGWMLAPFHAVGILRPGLEKVAYAHDPNSSWAGLNIASGLNYHGPSSTPLLFPGDGMSTNLTSWGGGESPDPLETCGWQNQFPGPGLIAMLPEAPAVGLTATLEADNGPDFSSAGGGLCIVDEHTYVSTDPVYGPTGASILSGGDHPVFLFPSSPLAFSRYHATIKQPGKPDIAWSFIATPPGEVTGGAALTLHVAAGEQTVMGNLTVTEPWGAGFTTVYPCAAGRPNASNNNYVAGQTIPNFVVAHPDASGDICVYTSNAGHLIWDQVADTNVFGTHTAVRLLDTRAVGKPAAGGVIQVHVTDTGAQTVMGNLTVTEPSGPGFTTVYPCAAGRPNASNNNYVSGQTIPNFVAAHPDANGDICIYTQSSAHLIWDQVSETGAFGTHTAVRVYDTRVPMGYR